MHPDVKYAINLFKRLSNKANCKQDVIDALWALMVDLNLVSLDDEELNSKRTIKLLVHCG